MCKDLSRFASDRADWDTAVHVSLHDGIFDVVCVFMFIADMRKSFST